ncbi:MAG: hypothetical protein JST58_07010 [Bacteroidetes bacterium]|nr:hypothetical protein [Bacteroidota bacterium]
MLKRIAVIGILTGIGQLFSVMVIKWVAQKTNSAMLAQLGNVDSMFQLLLNIIALGLQSAAIRNIALHDDWKEEYGDTQSARLTLAILLMPIAMMAFFHRAYIIFLIAPLLALSGDYALYARGYSVRASAIALLRLLIPYSAVLLTVVFLKDGIDWFYVAGLVLAYLVSNVFISQKLGTHLFYPIRFSSLLMYIKSLPLGLLNLSLYFNGLGLLVVAPNFYTTDITGVAFVGLKLYVIVKGVLRILQQAFFKEMLNDEICLRVDMLSMVVVCAFFGGMVIFPESTIRLFFGAQFLGYKTFFMLLAVAMLFYGFTTSMAIKALIKRKDRSFTMLTFFSALSALLTEIVLSFFFKSPNALAWSLIFAEMIFCVGLLFLMGARNILMPRIMFLGKCFMLLFAIGMVRFFLNDNLLLDIICISCFVLILLFLHRGKLNSLVHQ